MSEILNLNINKHEKSKSRASLEKYLNKDIHEFHFYTNDDILDVFDKDHSLDVEVWHHSLKLMHATFLFYNRSSFQITDVSQKDWNEMFVRDEFSQKRILEAAKMVAVSGKTAFNVAQKHEVREAITNGLAHIVEVVAIAPLFGRSKITNQVEFIGFVAAVKFH